MRNFKFLLLFSLVVAGCNGAQFDEPAVRRETLTEARANHVTKIVKEGPAQGPPEVPNGDLFKLIHYPSPVGQLAAYVTKDPSDGLKQPAIVWITGGDNNSIGNVWSPRERDNDQSVSAFRKAGVVVMFPSQRGGNDNPGKREGFYGEVDDVLAATDYLASLPYVDPQQIYLGGHSTGGTLAMLIGASTDRYRAIFALGPVASVSQYGGDYVYCDADESRDGREMELRSPINWLHCVANPMFVIEGEEGNWEGAVQVMKFDNTNPDIKFFKVDGYDHFNVIGPVVEKLADQIMRGKIDLPPDSFEDLK